MNKKQHKSFSCVRKTKIRTNKKTFESLVSAKDCAKKGGHVNESDCFLPVSISHSADDQLIIIFPISLILLVTFLILSLPDST